MHIINLHEHRAFLIFGLCSRAAPSMITIIWDLKMINFALDHPSEGVALIRKLASYSANHYAFEIIFLFLIKMPAAKVSSTPLL